MRTSSDNETMALENPLNCGLINFYCVKYGLINRLDIIDVFCFKWKSCIRSHR